MTKKINTKFATDALGGGYSGLTIEQRLERQRWRAGSQARERHLMAISGLGEGWDDAPDPSARLRQHAKPKPLFSRVAVKTLKGMRLTIEAAHAWACERYTCVPDLAGLKARLAC